VRLGLLRTVEQMLRPGLFGNDQEPVRKREAPTADAELGFCLYFTELSARTRWKRRQL
jgi:hypothetical protein